MGDILRERVVAALKNAFIADALAMPVHWFYNPADILKVFPNGIRHFEDAPSFHPSSIMSLHATTQGGRARDSAPSEKYIVGDVILKGKQQFWSGANQHYHQGMKAGENTLNAQCARVLLRALSHRYDRDTFLQNYISFMCADPPLHPDTYAESYHRGFFANLVAGKPAHLCGAVTHDTPSVGGLVSITPLALIEALHGAGLEQLQQITRRHLLLTHPSEALATVSDFYVELLFRLLHRDEQSPSQILQDIALRSANLSLKKLIAKQRSDIEVVGHHYSSACYISNAWPSVLYFAYRYSEDGKKALLANTNVGGDNVHRGFVLGAIMGLIEQTSPASLFEHLTEANTIEQEIIAACDNRFKQTD
ncbi:ADP-ribosylglycohydrolase family protein [Salinimonas marina]|uniref:ADP-ribosylglycohydrolase family protein n=1 Tax=Salinimonas marina TaxID=2785918 RepID=A0A7S9HDI2_9ALTE|nr:ADP-ribosylglycohydrolase family protein [Salinimonas marina]QPG06169.1 ADP-ribosylglycohydrolase family protein [Salinimonas marina]